MLRFPWQLPLLSNTAPNSKSVGLGRVHCLFRRHFVNGANLKFKKTGFFFSGVFFVSLLSTRQKMSYNKSELMENANFLSVFFSLLYFLQPEESSIFLWAMKLWGGVRPLRCYRRIFVSQLKPWRKPVVNIIKTVWPFSMLITPLHLHVYAINMNARRSQVVSLVSAWLGGNGFDFYCRQSFKTTCQAEIAHWHRIQENFRKWSKK